MPRYFFDTISGDRDRDAEGTELEDLSAARKRAIVYAGAVMENEPAVLWDGSEFYVQVSDDRGQALFTLTAFVTNSPAGGDTK